ncbi:unnamed protein product, partial [Dibothriocephalus latus]
MILDILCLEGYSIIIGPQPGSDCDLVTDWIRVSGIAAIASDRIFQINFACRMFVFQILKQNTNADVALKLANALRIDVKGLQIIAENRIRENSDFIELVKRGSDEPDEDHCGPDFKVFNYVDSLLYAIDCLNAQLDPHIPYAPSFTFLKGCSLRKENSAGKLMDAMHHMHAITRQ